MTNRRDDTRPHAAGGLSPRAPNATRPPLAVYVHWPYCLAKCPYCDFNSHVRDSIDTDAMAAAYAAELEYFAGLSHGRQVETVFFGGGTPSLMPPEITARVIDRIDRLWGLAADAEITLEANPTSADAGRFAGYREAGVNRLSLGLQALDDSALRFLGRQHDTAGALAALDMAARTFPRVSADLIYGRTGQRAADWETELGRALDLPVAHLSLYQLTIEKGTPFFADARDGRLELPGEDTLRELFDLTAAMTAAAGMPAYEVSNFARPGEACRHNLAYWTYRPYVGVGPGAHGRLPVTGAPGEAPAPGRCATRQHAKPETWLETVTGQGHGTAEMVDIARDEMAAEALMMGLRLTGGIAADDFERETGRALQAAFEPAAANRLVEGGFLHVSPAGIRLTEKGRPFLDAVLRQLAG